MFSYGQPKMTLLVVLSYFSSGLASGVFSIVNLSPQNDFIGYFHTLKLFHWLFSHL